MIYAKPILVGKIQSQDVFRIFRLSDQYLIYFCHETYSTAIQATGYAPARWMERDTFDSALRFALHAYSGAVVEERIE